MPAIPTANDQQSCGSDARPRSRLLETRSRREASSNSLPAVVSWTVPAGLPGPSGERNGAHQSHDAVDDQPTIDTDRRLPFSPKACTPINIDCKSAVRLSSQLAGPGLHVRVTERVNPVKRGMPAQKSEPERGRGGRTPPRRQLSGDCASGVTRIAPSHVLIGSACGVDAASAIQLGILWSSDAAAPRAPCQLSLFVHPQKSRRPFLGGQERD